MWTGNVKPDGYGRFGQRKAHRLAWALEYGPIPAGHDIHHREGCTSRLCVEPMHLQALPHADHARLGHTMMPYGPLHGVCKRGHRGEYRRRGKRKQLQCAACHRELMRAYKAFKASAR